jgi:hypothetical protein
VIKANLDLGLVFDDRSSTGKTRDAYPIALFRLENVIKLFSKKYWVGAIYLIPWTFAKDSRRFLLERALSLLMFFSLDETKGAPYLNEPRAAASNVMPLKPMTLSCVMSTITGRQFALVELDWNFPLDRISRHPLENFFGPLQRFFHHWNKGSF